MNRHHLIVTTALCAIAFGIYVNLPSALGATAIILGVK